jgi:hypothetical protein
LWWKKEIEAGKELKEERTENWDREKGIFPANLD